MSWFIFHTCLALGAIVATAVNIHGRYFGGAIVTGILFFANAWVAYQELRKLKGKPNRVYESVTHLSVGPYSIRVWRSESEITMGHNDDLRAWAHDIDKANLPEGDFNARVIALEIEQKFPRVTAVEVTLGDSSALLYPNWH